MVRTLPTLAVLLVLGFAAFAIPVGAQPAKPGAWEIPDDAGDQYVEPPLYPFVQPPVVASPAFAHGDLRRVTIDAEDGEGIQVSFHVEALKVQARPKTTDGYELSCRGSSYGFNSEAGPEGIAATYTLSFQGEDTSFRYYVIARLNGENSAAGFVAHYASAYVCLSPEGPNAPVTRTLFSWIDVTLDEPNRAIHIHVPKAGLLALLPSACGDSCDRVEVRRPILLKAGDKLRQFRASAETGSSADVIFVQPGRTIRDVAPATGDGPEYVLQQPVANVQIRVEFPSGAGGIPVVPGVNQSIKARVTNHNDAKRLIQLDAQLRGASQGWTVWGPKVLTVPPHESRDIYYALNVSSGASLDEAPKLAINGTSLGHPDERGLAVAKLLPQLALGPDSRTLYLHTKPDRQGYFGVQQAAAVTCDAPVLAYTCFHAWLSPREADPAAVAPDMGRVRFFVGSAGDVKGYVPEAWLTPGLPLPVFFDPKVPVELHLKLRSAVPVEGLAVTAMLGFGNASGRFSDALPLAEGSVTASVGPTAPDVVIKMPINGPSQLPAYAGLRLRIQMTAPVGPNGAAALADGVDVIGKETRLELPLLPLPPEAALLVNPSPFQLTARSGTEEFVNPGEARLYNVTILNLGSGPHVAHLTAETSPATWTARILPGDAFNLAPGDLLQLGVLLYAPKGAKEGERSVAWLNASEPGQATASLRVAGVSVSADVPDDSGAYVPDAEAKEHLVKTPPKGAPGPAPLVVLSCFACAWLLARRGRNAA